jgi:hypothetical protein
MTGIPLRQPSLCWTDHFFRQRRGGGAEVRRPAVARVVDSCGKMREFDARGALSLDGVEVLTGPSVAGSWLELGLAERGASR